MFVLLPGFILFLALGMLSSPAHAADVSKEQTKSLDEQVQEIKGETIGIGAQMRLLEEKLLYPSSTQVAVYVSSDNATKYRLDSIEIQLDGNLAARHVYTAREIEALQKGGVQRIYTGNLVAGEHGIQALIRGKAKDGSDVKETKNFKFSKDEGPRVVEVHLVDSDAHRIKFRDW